MPAPEPNRLFFALSPPDEVRAQVAVAAEALRKTQRLGGRLLKRERYHITLLFLGDYVPAGVETAARQAAAHIQAPPFTLRLDQAGSFRNRQIPVWLSVSEPPPELAFLEQALRKAMSGLPLARQPRFVPHLTLIREATAPLRKQPVAPIDWPVEEFTLIRSILHQQPARYETCQRYRLCGGPLPPTDAI